MKLEEPESTPNPPKCDLDPTVIESRVSSLRFLTQEGIRRTDHQKAKLHLSGDIPTFVNITIGTTGSGKTTTVQIAGGDLATLSVPDPPTAIIDTERIGLPSTDSRTSIPEFVVNPESQLIFLDCPGFEDNRGEENDIAAMFLIKRVMDSMRHAKFILTVPYSAMKLENDRLTFGVFAEHGVRFLTNLQQMVTAVGLIVTKVDNFNNFNGNPISDDDVFKSIVTYLNSYANSLEQKLRNRNMDQIDRDDTSKQLLLVNTLLQKSGGRYHRIWFIRRPTQSGPLNQSEYYQKVRQEIGTMFQRNIDPVPVQFSDFGLTLKAETRLKVRQYVAQINSQILADSLQKFESVLSNYFAEFEHKLQNQKGLEETLRDFSEVVDTVTKLTDMTPSTFLEKVTQLLEALRMQNTQSEFLSQIEAQEGLVHFFADICEEALERPSAFEVVTLVHSKLVSKKESTWTTVQNEIMTEVKKNIEDALNHLLSHIGTLYSTQFKQKLGHHPKAALDQLHLHSDQLREAMGLNILLCSQKEVINGFAEMLLGSKLEAATLTELCHLENHLQSLEEITTLTNPPPQANLAHLLNHLNEIKDEAMDKLREDMPEALKLLEKIVGDLITVDLKDKVVAKFELDFESDSKQALRQFKDDYKTLNGFITELINSKEHPSNLVVQLYDKLHQNLGEDQKQALNDKETAMGDISGIITGKVEAIHVQKPFHDLKTEFTNLRTRIAYNLSESVIPGIHSKILEETQTLVDHCGDTFFATKFYPELSPESLRDKLEVLRGPYDKLKNFAGRWREPSLELASIFGEVKNLFGAFGYPPPEAGRLKELEEELDFYDDVLEKRERRPFDRWIGGAVGLFGKIQDLLLLYTFYVTVGDAMERYDVQQKMRDYSTNIPEVEELMRHLQLRQVVFVNPNVVEIFERAEGRDREVLREIVEGLVTSTVAEVYDEDEEKLVVTGKYVKFSSFVGGLEGRSSMRKLQVFASDTVYIDKDLNGGGRDLTVVMIANKWEVVGERRQILLNGAPGVGHIPERAESGKEGSRGGQGRPGNPGGNGGAFFGVFNEHVNGSALCILVNGGDGGRGQHGGNGGTGMDGRDATFDDFPRVQTVSVFNTLETNAGKVGLVNNGDDSFTKVGQAGGVGGPGGNGGVGGKPGYPGTVKVIGVGEIVQNFQIFQTPGKVGECGLGGDGGLGGNDGDGLRCKLVNDGMVPAFLSFAVATKKWEEDGPIHTTEKASEGEKGRSGGNAQGLQEPGRQSIRVLDWQTVEDFKRFVEGTGSQVGGRFVSLLESSPDIPH